MGADSRIPKYFSSFFYNKKYIVGSAHLADQCITRELLIEEFLNIGSFILLRKRIKESFLTQIRDHFRIACIGNSYFHPLKIGGEIRLRSQACEIPCSRQQYLDA